MERLCLGREDEESKGMVLNEMGLVWYERESLGSKSWPLKWLYIDCGAHNLSETTILSFSWLKRTWNLFSFSVTYYSLWWKLSEGNKFRKTIQTSIASIGPTNFGWWVMENYKSNKLWAPWSLTRPDLFALLSFLSLFLSYFLLIKIIMIEKDNRVEKNYQIGKILQPTS